jgi:regulator of sirC expression with transglutaminase-like and TPR domain
MHEEAGLGQREYRNLLLDRGRYAQLMASARVRLSADPDDMPAWWDLGAAALGADDARSAADAYRAALSHLPRWLDRHTRLGHGHGLTPEEADLTGLWSVAALLAGDAPGAETSCAALAHRQRPEDHYDRLCRAYLLWHAGDAAGARAQLSQYLPPAPEHERLSESLAQRLSAG